MKKQNSSGNGSGNDKNGNERKIHFKGSGYTFCEKDTKEGKGFSVSFKWGKKVVEKDITKEMYDNLIKFEYAAKWSDEKYYSESTSMFDEEGNEMECADPRALNPSDEVAASHPADKISDKTDRRIMNLLLDGYNQVEIANALSISEATVSRRISRLRKQLI
jgi:uncharacterized membrane protein